MSYALDVEPDVIRALRTLDVDVQEAAYDLLDRLAAEGPELTPVHQRHEMHARTPAGRTFVLLEIVVDHERQSLRVYRLHALVR